MRTRGWAGDIYMGEEEISPYPPRKAGLVEASLRTRVFELPEKNKSFSDN